MINSIKNENVKTLKRRISLKEGFDKQTFPCSHNYTGELNCTISYNILKTFHALRKGINLVDK